MGVLERVLPKTGEKKADGPQVTVLSSPESSYAGTPYPGTPRCELVNPFEESQEAPVEALEKRAQFGRLASWRGALILLVTSGAQFLDNVFMTSANIALSSIQEEFHESSTNLQWMISAYTLTFGGFLLLAGVLSDRCVHTSCNKSIPF